MSRNYDDIYLPELNKIVDDLFQMAADNKWTWADMAEQSGLAYSTIKKLGTRQTRYPELRTVQLLAEALGGHVEFNTTRNRRRRRRWEPKIFDGRAA